MKVPTSLILWAISLNLFIPSGLVLAATDAGLIDRQDTAVATNLGLYGAQPMDITTDPSNSAYVYMASYVPNGIFYSSDGGTTWNGLANDSDYGAGKSVAVDANTGDVYALVGDNIIKSTDHGETWESLTDNLVDHPIIGETSLFTSNIYVAAVDSGQVQISTDGGISFTEITLAAASNSLGHNIISLAADTNGTIYAILQDEAAETSTLFRSQDSGSTWADLAVENAGIVTGSRFYGVTVDPANSDHLVLASYNPNYDSYHSLDGGANWLALENNGQFIGGNEAVFNGAGSLYLGNYFTADPESITPTWTAITTTTPLSSVRGDIYAVDYTNPLTLYSNTGLGVAKSENGGTTWVDQVDGMTAVQTFDIAQANDKNIVWIGANGGLAKTTNFTDTVPTWEYPILPDVGISSVQAVWVKPNNGNYVVAGLSDYISISTNGGATWNHASTPAFFGRIEEIVPSSVDSQTLYAVYTNTSLIDDYYNGGVLKSIDSGVNWTELNFPTTLASSALAVATNDGHDVLYVGIGSGGNETGVYTYNGTNWEKLDEDFNGLYVNNILVQPEDNNIIFVSCEAASTIGSLFKSTDAGATWMVITAGLTDANHLGAMAVQSDKNDTMYLAGQESSSNQGLIYKSTDGGESWSTYYTGLKQEFYYALQFDGLISGNDRGLFSLKSLGKITLKSYRQNGQATLRITLRDAATRDVLSDRSLKIYRKVSGQTWKIIKRATTNKRGRIVVRAAAAKKTKFKVIWQPQSADQAEYTKTTSRLLTID